MKVRNQRIHRRAGSLVLAVGLGSCIFSSAACGSLETEPESVAAATSALGSTWPTPQSIGNWTQLTQMVSGGNYKLTANIDAAGKTWTPKDFTGTFDGGGNTISNLTISSSANAVAGFFANINSGIVRNVKFTNVNVSGSYAAGAVAGTAEDSLIEMVSVQGTVSAPGGLAAGGLVGLGGGSTFNRCSMKGSVTQAQRYAGGITGFLNAGSNRGFITQSYSWATITPDTSDAGRDVWAGGLVGWTFGATVQDVYAVGNVTGRGHTGGLVGALDCDDSHPFVLNHGVYRGDVIDKTWTPSGGWSGTFGTYQECTSRFDQLIWAKNLDGSTNTGSHGDAQKSASASQLMSPTTVSSGVYSWPDNLFDSAIWDAGSSAQHHSLKNMPGGTTVQPRCESASGVASAC
jgi:hypothetical protein